MDLTNISTSQLVEELMQREAVEKITVEPYQDYKITVGDNEFTDSGPIILLRIWD